MSIPEYKSDELVWQPCDATEIAELTGGKEYLFYVTEFNEGQTLGQLSILKTSESQYFRRAIANKLGMLGEYDYKQFPQLDLVKKSLDLLLDSNHVVLRETMSA